MVDPAAEKAQLRLRLRARPIAPDAHVAIDEQLETSTALGSCKVVMAYLAMPDEVDVDSWIARALHRGVSVCVPRVHWEDRTMEAVRLERTGDWVVGRFGLREPAATATVVPIEHIEAVLVPGLGFDLDGYRLGRGGGFYDRYLAGAPSALMRLGIAPDERIVKRVPRESWDEPVSHLVGERGVRRVDRTVE